MKEFYVEERLCGTCRTPMQTDFFVYVSDNEQHDKWLTSMKLVEEYCDRCFRDTPRVMLFIEFFCPGCGNYTGIYMECTPYTKAHFLTEISATGNKILLTRENG